MEPFENIARNVFSEIIINKSFIHKAGFGARAIPTYVGEWIISHFVGEAEDIDDLSRGKMAAFMKKYVPAKGEKESINNTQGRLILNCCLTCKNFICCSICIVII